MRGMRLTDELCEYRVWLISPIPNTIIRQIYKKQKFLGSIPLFCHFFALTAYNQGSWVNFFSLSIPAFYFSLLWGPLMIWSTTRLLEGYANSIPPFFSICSTNIIKNYLHNDQLAAFNRYFLEKRPKNCWNKYTIETIFPLQARQKGG